MSARITFTCTVSASDADDAEARVAKRLPDGLLPTGRVAVRSERHMLWNVEVSGFAADRNDVWVRLTSYGISPSDELASTWQTVVGVGC